VLAATWRSMSAAMEESVNVLTMPTPPTTREPGESQGIGGRQDLGL
jgi:hypothetical protein